MPQFQTQVPDPLRDQLPALLPAGSMRAPAVGIKLVVFIGERRLEGTTMQIQLHHIDDCETLLGQAGEEEFVDDAPLVSPPPGSSFCPQGGSRPPHGSPSPSSLLGH